MFKGVHLFSLGRQVYLLFLAIHHEMKFRSPGKLDGRERGRGEREVGEREEGEREEGERGEGRWGQGK